MIATLLVLCDGLKYMFHEMLGYLSSDNALTSGQIIVGCYGNILMAHCLVVFVTRCYMSGSSVVM